MCSFSRPPSPPPALVKDTPVAPGPKDFEDDDELEAEVGAEAAGNVKRVVFGDVEEESPYAIADFLEMKTLWQSFLTRSLGLFFR